MKCNDLLYYIMRHFGVEFNMDEKDIPRQWVEMKVEDITALYVIYWLKCVGIVEEKVSRSVGEFQKVWPFRIRGGINPANGSKTQENDLNDNVEKQPWGTIIIKVIPEPDPQTLVANEEPLRLGLKEERKSSP